MDASPVCSSGDPGKTPAVIREELRRLATWEERHRRLAARIAIALALSLVVDLAGAVFFWAHESGLKGSEIHGRSSRIP